MLNLCRESNRNSLSLRPSLGPGHSVGDNDGSFYKDFKKEGTLSPNLPYQVNQRPSPLINCPNPTRRIAPFDLLHPDFDDLRLVLNPYSDTDPVPADVLELDSNTHLRLLT